MTTPATKETLRKMKTLSGVDSRKVIKHEMPTIEGFEWPALTEYDLTQSNIKPVEDDVVVELRYEVERLKRDLELQTDLKNKSIKEHHAYMVDYRKLDTDYLNSQSEVKRLQAQVDKIPGLKRTLQWLMIEHLEMDIKLLSVEEKKEVDRTWL